MADEDDFESDEPEFEAAPESGGGSRKKLILIVAIPLVLVLGGGAAAYFTGLADPLLAMFHKEQPAEGGEVGAAGHESEAKTAETAKAPNAAEQPIVNYELPDMLVNIDTGSRAKSFLKIKASVELNNEADIERVVAVLPKIVDNFQVYLREMKQEDLAGAAGMYKLREELLIRINAAVRPVQVKDVLFKEFIVQ
ncbi:MAG: flagellar basal body-associated FliL family protein [Rhodospirillaceae bacterium]|nr:flagellar basal body-associated FliL family protein [Rhodospirillaceae bacterium]